MNPMAKWPVAVFLSIMLSLSSVGAIAVAVKRDDVVIRNPEPQSRSSYGKVGLVWSNGEDQHLHQYVTSKTHFLYTWHPNCPKPAAGLGLDCARMLWGPKEVNQFRQLRTTPGTNILMGMNEVNEPSQSNMTPQAGIQLWNAEIRPFGLQGYKLISPSVTADPSGKKWFQTFFADCGSGDGQPNCGAQILSIHIYVIDAQTFKSLATDFHNTFGMNVWITEFACQNFWKGSQASRGQVWAFMSDVTSWMNQQSWIEAYFAFGLLHDMWNVNADNQLMNPDGSPSPLGSLYINS